jgi:hypothetical protein
VRRAAAVATVAGVFVLGAVVGALGLHLAHVHRRFGPFGGPPEFGLVRPWLERRLDLTAEQAERIEAILDRHHREMFELRREMMPEFDDRFAATVAEIEAELTPEQRERFRRVHPTFGHFGHRRHGHSGGGEREEPPR